jgi:hypothetical protein
VSAWTDGEEGQINNSAECRNVLVRYCAHIPRNYQYRDGVRLVRCPIHLGEQLSDKVQVFLVLRDHLGDEFLGLAGGVLYEMIEVDCHYSDDPGAAFQRWRHDHLNRHVRRVATSTTELVVTQDTGRPRAPSYSAPEHRYIQHHTDHCFDAVERESPSKIPHATFRLFSRNSEVFSVSKWYWDTEDMDDRTHYVRLITPRRHAGVSTTQSQRVSRNAME